MPIPDEPPFTAFIGSMSFESTDADLSAFFEGLPVTSIRIVTEGFSGKSKGFGYVEFSSREALEDALSRTGGVITGRPVRISVAEPPRSSASAADGADQWRRSGPALTSSRPSHGGFGSGGFDDGPSGFDSMDVAGGVRAGFGSKFNPSAAAPRTSRFGGGDFDPAAGDDASNWRTGKPVESRGPPTRSFSHTSTGGEDVVLDRSAFGQKVRDAPVPDERLERSERPGRMGFGRTLDSDVTLDRSTFGTKVSTAAPAQERRGGFFERRTSNQPTSPGATPAEEADQWRRSGPVAPSAPRERPHLKLQPRSANPRAAAVNEPANSGKPSPFGAAKPVDNAEREREIAARAEERRRAEAEQRKQQERSKSAAVSETTSDAGSEGPKHPPTNPWKSVPSKQPAGAKPSKSAPAAAAAATTTTAAAAAPPKSPKPPAPTGAWGAGRAPAGALEKKLEETKLE